MNKTLNIGKILKLNRILLNIKQDYIASKLAVTRSYYSRIENNKAVLTDEQAKIAFDSIGIEYNNEDIYDEFEEAYLEFVKTFTYYNDFEEAYKKVESFESKVKSTILYPKYLLANFIYKHKTGNTIYKEDCEILENYFEYFELYDIQLYYDFIGLTYLRREENQEADYYFDKALEYNGIELTRYMVEYHKGLVYRRLGKFGDALRSLGYARDYFVRTLNIKRIVMTEGQIAIVNQNMNNVEYGLTKHFQCLEAFKTLNMTYEIYNTYNSILWSYMKDGQYHNVLKIKDEALYYAPTDPYFYFMISYTYYKMNDISNAKKYINNANLYLSNCNDEFKITIINALYTILNTEDKQSKEIVLLDVYKASTKCQDQEVEQFSLQLLCDFYREYNELKQLIKYMDLLIQCHKRLE